jgi:hypothetical protein
MFDPQFIPGPDGLTPRDHAWLDGLTSDELAIRAATRPRDWSRSASRTDGVDARIEAAIRTYAAKVLSAREVTA